MNCDKCKHYNWYYDYCDKWNCTVDDREVHSCYEERIFKISKIKKQYGFPLWLIKEALEYYDGDEDKAIKKLIEIYRVIGDCPDVMVRRNIEKFMEKVAMKNESY